MAVVGNGRSWNVRNVRPPVVTTPPSMWDHFLSTMSFDDQVQEKYAEEIETLKTNVRSILMAAKSTKLITLIDTVEHLGLAYHFETEIKQKLCQVYSSDDHYNLFAASLRFRLLRQHQYHVSCYVFEKFVDKDGKFKEALSTDIEGLLSLYEAAHIRIHNEDILDEAVIFTTDHLNSMLPELKHRLKDKVQRALKQSFHRGILILNVPLNISIYGKEDSRDELLLKLAKLSFKILQNMYRKELSELSRWWNKFDLKSKLPYMRDRLVECYLWGMAFHFEPQYSFVRMEITKNIKMVSVIDDTYDNYATLEEAKLFTRILQSWNMNEIDLLPDYMKIVYRFVMSVYEDFEGEAAKQQKSYAVPCYREAVKQLGRAYTRELKWVMERHMPTFEEYMTNTIITSALNIFFSALIPGIKSATKETIDWVLSRPKILISTARTGRHVQDLSSHERENREGKLLTVVDCYMKDRGVSKQETLSEFARLVEKGWKDINEEWANGTSVPKEIVEQFVNHARSFEVTYKNDQDGYTYPEKILAPQIVALFVDPLN